MIFDFVVKGIPKPQKRHRHTKRGFTYDPSLDDKRKFISIIQLQAPKKPLDGGLAIKVKFYMPRPKKHFRTGKFSNELKPNVPYIYNTIPDIDNLLKFVMDSCNKILWHDDARIWRVEMEKVYSNSPRTEINVEVTHERLQ